MDGLTRNAEEIDRIAADVPKVIFRQIRKEVGTDFLGSISTDDAGL